MNLKKLFHNASRDTLEINARLQNSEPQCNQTPALGATVEGKETSLQRVTVSFIGYRTRPLDPDNFAGSVKDLLDGLRHAGIIHDDDPWSIKMHVWQEKVHHRSEERTVIEIQY